MKQPTEPLPKELLDGLLDSYYEETGDRGYWNGNLYTNQFVSWLMLRYRAAGRGAVANSLQQLKAKIAALAARLDPLFGKDDSTSKELTDIAEEMRKLSAV